jgi:hypothetical protein
MPQWCLLRTRRERVGPCGSDLGCELIKHPGVVVIDRIDQAGQQNIGPLAGVGKEAADQIQSTLRLNLPSSQACEIDERAILLFALQQALFEEAVQGSHDGGVGQRRAKTLRYLLHIRTPQRQKHRQHLPLPLAQLSNLQRTCGVRRDRGRSANPLCWRFDAVRSAWSSHAGRSSEAMLGMF